MNLFTLLRQHGKNQPEAVAVSSHFRMMTYRRFWSRIERATARVQEEWGVKSGDTVLYRGQAHPDALVLYLALARGGARLAALEHPLLQSDMDMIVHELDVKIILYNDHLPFDDGQSLAPMKPLSSLIMTRCPYQPSMLKEDTSCPSLVAIGSTPHNGSRLNFTSLDQMAHQRSDISVRGHRITDSLFDSDIFAPVVLPTLISGATLIFG